MDVNAGRVLGLALDISLVHIPEGNRVLDVVKKQLIDFTRETMEGEDIFYLYHPELIDPVYDIGKIVSAIGNYETDGWLFDLRYALKLTYYVVAAQDDDAQKMVMFITNRAKDEIATKKLLMLEDRDQSGCQFVFVGIGNSYDRSVLDIVHDQVTYFHLDQPSDLSDTLLEKI